MYLAKVEEASNYYDQSHLDQLQVDVSRSSIYKVRNLNEECSIAQDLPDKRNIDLKHLCF